jgi:preprotein translocase subunit SecE
MQPTKNESKFEGIRRFFRNVVAELKKVNWPSRKELITYTIVVWDTTLTAVFKAMGFYGR